MYLTEQPIAFGSKTRLLLQALLKTAKIPGNSMARKQRLSRPTDEPDAIKKHKREKPYQRDGSLGLTDSPTMTGAEMPSKYQSKLTAMLSRILSNKNKTLRIVHSQFVIVDNIPISICSVALVLPPAFALIPQLNFLFTPLQSPFTVGQYFKPRSILQGC